MSDGDEQNSNEDSGLSVVDRVLTAFTKAVSEEEGYGDIATRLRVTLLETRDLSESALERALFEVEAS